MSVSAIAGPGWMPHITKAPIRIAIPDDPGIPERSVGRSDAPSLGLLAVSGAMTPRTSPLPKLSGSLAFCTELASEPWNGTE
jgi:hypothetical protein